MATKGKQAKEYLNSELSKATTLLREKEFSPQQKDELLKNLSEDEVSLIQKNRRTEAVKKAKNSWNASKSTEEYTNSQIEYQESMKLREMLMKKGISLEDAQKLLFGEGPKNTESKETASRVPSAIIKQEEDAIKYFEECNEPKHLKVVKGIQKLRAEGKITYIDLGEGRYEVMMPCGSRKLKMYFPPDVSISDTENTYTNFAGETITNKETTRGKLWSKEGIKHLEQQEKSHKGLRTKAEFLELGKSLCPDGNEEEQILAFMMATGFYGWMRLSDTDAKKKDYQLAVGCYLNSGHRYFGVGNDFNNCSLVHSTFVG